MSGTPDRKSAQSKTFTFTDFLNKLKHDSSSYLVKEMKVFADEFAASAPAPDEESSALSCMERIETKVMHSTQWKGCSEEELENSKEGIEKYLMTKIYARAWCPSDIEIQKDAALTSKMDLLRELITAEHLDIPAPFQNEQAFQMARTEILRVNNYKAPRDKLTCVINCCKVINIHLVHLAKQAAAEGESAAQSISADDFLPVLIFVVLQAKVPHLYSNVQYIMRYRHHTRMVSEAAYHFTNLSSVVAFFEHCSAGDFSIDTKQYDTHMAGFHEAAAPSTQSVDQQARTAEAVALPHRFVDSELSDLRVGDVKILLAEYKLLARAFDELNARP